MIRIPNIVLNITTGLFAGIGAYTGNYWYLCGSAVCIAIYYYHKWEDKKNSTEGWCDGLWITKKHESFGITWPSI